MVCSRSVFQHDDDDDDKVKALDTILSLVKYVDSVCAVALRQESANILLTHCVLQFFELVRTASVTKTTTTSLQLQQLLLLILLQCWLSLCHSSETRVHKHIALSLHATAFLNSYMYCFYYFY